MNISEFERLLRENAPEAQYAPQDERWQSLLKDLQPHKARLLPIAVRWTAAASAVIVIATSLYYILNTSRLSLPEITRKEKAAEKNFASKAIEAMAKKADPLDIQSEKDIEPSGIEKKRVTALIQQRIDTPTVTKRSAASCSNPAQSGPQAPLVVQQPQPNRQLPVSESPELSAPHVDQRNRRLQLGITALYGMSGISKGQYSIALEGRRDLSGRLFANVQLMAAAATIASTIDYNYQSIVVGPPGVAGNTAVQTTSAKYRGSVYTVGFAPGIGMQLTNKLALSAGPDVQKRLGGDLVLRNKEEFQNTLTNQSLIDERKQVADIDFGLQSAAVMTVNQRLAFTLRYRYGITAYLQTIDGAARNSFLLIGLSYRFNH